MRRGSTTSRRLTRIQAAAAGLVLLAAGSSVVGAPRTKESSVIRAARRRAAMSTPRGPIVGQASWYGPGFHGRRTASGERFNRNAMTLASRHLPFGTRVRITNLKNGKTVIGRVNDRGPFVHGRIVDLSQGMARKLGIGGVGKVKVEVVPKETAPAAAAKPAAPAGESTQQ
jgi:rare lipoprotein A